MHGTDLLQGQDQLAAPCTTVRCLLLIHRLLLDDITKNMSPEHVFGDMTTHLPQGHDLLISRLEGQLSLHGVWVIQRLLGGQQREEEAVHTCRGGRVAHKDNFTIVLETAV